MLECEIAAWTRESEKAGKWLSLTIKPKQDRQQSVTPTGGRERFNEQVQEMGTPMDGDDSDISF